MTFRTTLSRTFVGLLLLTSLSSCDDNSACADSTECGDGAACVRSENAMGTCFSLCATDSACPGGEFCVPRVEQAENVVLVWPDVCVPSEMLFSFEPTPTGCAARSVDDCQLDSDCWLEVGWRLDRARRCREREPAGCLGQPVLCLSAAFLAHNTEGEIFYFSSTCGVYGFAELFVEPGDPIYDELFGTEPMAYSWPECE